MNIKRLAITVAMCGVAAIAAQSTKSDAQVDQSQGQQVEPMENPPVFKAGSFPHHQGGRLPPSWRIHQSRPEGH